MQFICVSQQIDAIRLLCISEVIVRFPNLFCACRQIKKLKLIISPGDLININKLQVFFIPRCSESDKYKRKNRQTITTTVQHTEAQLGLFFAWILSVHIFTSKFSAVCNPNTDALKQVAHTVGHVKIKHFLNTNIHETTVVENSQKILKMMCMYKWDA